jgi:hypothetical protein
LDVYDDIGIIGSICGYGSYGDQLGGVGYGVREEKDW